MLLRWLYSLLSFFRQHIVSYLIRRGRRKYGKMNGNADHITSRLVLKRNAPAAIDAEVDALAFVATHTNIPVPRVRYRWGPDENVPAHHASGFVMDLMEGVMLSRVWAKLSSPQRNHVMQTLAGFVAQLRQVSQPPLSPDSPLITRPGPPHPRESVPCEGWIGSASGRCFQDFSMSGQVSFLGPFPNERDFYDWRLSRFDTFMSHPVLAERLTSIRRDMRDDHRIVFTHGDIHRRNVLVRVNGEGPEDVEVTALLDWEQAGWRPEYWESRKWIFETPRPPEWADFAVTSVMGRGMEDEIRLDTELQNISGHIPP